MFVALAGIAVPSTSAPISLAPALTGQYAAGSGIDATFLKVHDTWNQSGVLYDPATDQLGAGQPIGNFREGDGLWGLVDWRTACQAPTPRMIESAWSGRVPEIAFGDTLYRSLYGDSWGAVALAPLFGPGSTASTQDNWTSRFSGYIRVSEAGIYDFGVLHDDGFFFNLGGAGGQTLPLANHYLNPRNRMSYGSGLQLDAGLYGFELGAYEHLEAGVVELSWTRDGDAWSRLPTDHLVAQDDVTPVPEQGSWTLSPTGLLTLGWTRSPRRSSRR